MSVWDEERRELEEAMLAVYEACDRKAYDDLYIDTYSFSSLLSDGRQHILINSHTPAVQIGREVKRRFASRLAMATWELS